MFIDPIATLQDDNLLTNITMHNYKALILDVDGTIVGNDYIISPKVKEAILSVKNKILVSLCSGRVFESVHQYVNELELTSLQITDGGGEIFDPVRHIPVYQKIIKTAIAKKIINDIKINNLHFVVSNHSEYHLDRSYISQETLDKYHFTRDYPLPDLNSATDWKLTKITIMGVTPENENKITGMLRPYSEEIHFVTAQYGLKRAKSFYSIDITEKSATKLSGLEKLLELYQLKKEDTVVCGDGYNDFPLLLAGGLKIAMGNAVPELKQIADFVAPSVAEDGVAVVIEKFLKE